MLDTANKLHQVSLISFIFVIFILKSHQPIGLFLTSDELYGPITSIHHDNRLIKHIPWSAFKLAESDWLRVVDACDILGVSGFLFYWPNDVWFNVQDSNQIQQYFSSEKELACSSHFQTAWEKEHNNPKYTLYKDALSKGLEKIRKYYSWLDDKPSFMLALGKYFFLF